MKKLLKFMSLLLIVPVLGIGSLLTGCGKEESSIEEIKNAYNEMIKTYHTDASDEAKLSASENALFTYTGDVALTTEKTYNYFKNTAGDATRVTFDINLGKLNKDSNPIPDVTISKDLEKKYEQLTEVYGELLDYSNLYFEKYQNDFFLLDGSYPNNVDGEELYKLEEKLDNLSDKLSAFYSNLKDRESLAMFLGSNTEIMKTKLNTFNSVYVDLIEANFEFVLKFCDIHKNYILNADTITAEATKEAAIAERYTYEAALKYAYGYFLDNIKSYQNNGLCDSSLMAEYVVIRTSDGQIVTRGTDPSNWVDDNGDNFNDEVKNGTGDDATVILEANVYFKEYNEFALKQELDELMDKVSNTATALSIKTEKAAELKQAISRIDAFTKLFKTNIDNFDMYTYNLLRIHSEESLYESMQEFVESLSDSNKARLTMIESYSSYDLTLLEDAIKNMFN